MVKLYKDVTWQRAMHEPILTSLDNHLYTITLNNPAKHNCIGFNMLYALEEAIKKAEKDENIKVVLITGAGNKSFSTGANIKEFESLKDGDINRWIEDGNRIFNQLETLPKPTIALIDGYAMGGGLELALCCDFRIGTENTLLSSPEMKNGWLPGWGGMTRLRRLTGEAIAKKIILLSDNLSAEEALQSGLLTRIFLTDSLNDQLNEFVAPLLKLDQYMYALAKNALVEIRTTRGSDVQFDVMAAHISKTKQNK